jgi:hypothetical protein
MTTEARLKIFKQMVIDAVDDCFDHDIYHENCPPEEYDYEAAGEEQPEDIDVDNEFFRGEYVGFKDCSASIEGSKLKICFVLVYS